MMRTLFRLVLVAVAIFSFNVAPGIIVDSHAAAKPIHKAYKPIHKAYKPIHKAYKPIHK